jgi:hypothetical protein
MNKHSELRAEIVKICQTQFAELNIEYRVGWLVVYKEYERLTNIPVTTWYKMGHKSKLDFLADYEDMYGTLTKLKQILKTDNNEEL